MSPQTLDKLSRWAPVALYAALIFWLSSRSSVPAAVELITDKVAHALLYGVFGALWSRALTNERPLNKITRWVLAVLLASAYGVSDEFHQSFVPHRTADVADWFADTVGAALGAGAYLLLLRRTREPGPHSRSR